MKIRRTWCVCYLAYCVAVHVNHGPTTCHAYLRPTTLAVPGGIVAYGVTGEAVRLRWYGQTASALPRDRARGGQRCGVDKLLRYWTRLSCLHRREPAEGGCLSAPVQLCIAMWSPLMAVYRAPSLVRLNYFCRMACVARCSGPYQHLYSSAYFRCGAWSSSTLCVNIEHSNRAPWFSW